MFTSDTELSMSTLLYSFEGQDLLFYLAKSGGAYGQPCAPPVSPPRPWVYHSFFIKNIFLIVAWTSLIKLQFKINLKGCDFYCFFFTHHQPQLFCKVSHLICLHNLALNHICFQGVGKSHHYMWIHLQNILSVLKTEFFLLHKIFHL